MLFIKNIKQLLVAGYEGKKMISGEGMSRLSYLEDAFLLTEGDKIMDFGGMSDVKPSYLSGDVLDASGKIVMPAFCDSHTHLVFAGSREKEFRDRILGLSYEEIARRGGGILNSAGLLHKTGDDVLYEQSLERVYELVGWGTGAVEIKSGYGLNTEDELRILRVIRRLKETTPLTIRATFLGAHAFPEEYKNNRTAYVDRIVYEMIPAVAAEGLADFIDVFCDRGFFTPVQTDRILLAGMKYGLRAKIHANELDYSGGVQTGVKYNALSADHLEFVGEEEISLLKKSETMPVVLPGTSFFLGLPYAPARRMIDAGLPVAIASDFNPGSSPTGNMKLMMSLACTQMKLLPEEALIAATINGAYAMGVEEELGSITPGKKANLIITKPVPGYEYLPYAYGSDLVEKVVLNGVVIR